ncbi:DNA methyltransferase [Oceaniradius stylonematis]|uniref:DNA methyltransferase n=1 Tax=Oceaniradius stylonematis TaxID=2184161 RepID=UPI003C7D6992
MSLSWNEIRRRAVEFADEYSDATYEKGETQSFYNDFFDVFGIKRRQVARYEEHVKKLSGDTGFIDLFWPKTLLVEQKSAGRDLTAAAEQAGEYFDAIRDADKPRFQLVCDFQNWELLDRDTRETWSFTLSELADNIQAFAFMIGREKRVFKDQDPVNIDAAELMGAIHDELEASGYEGHDLEVYLVRLLFMLFADDTGIFETRDMLLDFIEHRTSEDGSDLGSKINDLFHVLNTPEDSRSSNMDEDLARFPYVNGDLFGESLPPAWFTARMRDTFLEACRFNWSKVSPAIFGSLFQSVMDPAERRKKGAHYTTEKNIMKLIGPLFLDDLRAELDHLKGLKTGKAGRLEAFRRRLGTLTFLDPACGCGNFLIIAYRELRKLEIECLAELRGTDRKDLFGETISEVNVDQFYGIELEEFPARIAEVAMWMIDHIMNVEFGDAFGLILTRIPLTKSPHIWVKRNALREDWNRLLPAHHCSFVLGNPPFIGKHLQDPDQEADIENIFQKTQGFGKLDYVAAWLDLAADYIQNHGIRCAFVATNSITQGEQVAILWDRLFSKRIKINFAHRTFAWGSDARGKAHVHVVILGFSKMAASKARLFDYEHPTSEAEEIEVANVSPYLVDYKDMLIQSRRKPLADVPSILYGSKPVDGGNLLLTNKEKNAVFKTDPIASQFVRPMLSADEFINGKLRWCFWLRGASPKVIKRSAKLIERVRAVRQFRLASTKAATRRDAERPQEFAEIRQPSERFIAVPLHSSERRTYIPFGYFDADYIVHNSCSCVPDASNSHFGIMTSYMHMTWMRYTAGRIKSDYRYANVLVYNTFPWPHMSDFDKKKVGALAQAVLDARDEFPDATLADLYDPDLMPPALRKAHTALDRAVDRLYRKKPFESERERVEHLFGLYEKMVAPVEAEAKKTPKRRRRKKNEPANEGLRNGSPGQARGLRAEE